jgi:hypothetical protein
MATAPPVAKLNASEQKQPQSDLVALRNRNPGRAKAAQALDPDDLPMLSADRQKPAEGCGEALERRWSELTYWTLITQPMTSENSISILNGPTMIAYFLWVLSTVLNDSSTHASA